MGMDEESEDEIGEDETPQDTQIVTADISHIYAMDGRQKGDAIELIGAMGAGRGQNIGRHKKLPRFSSSTRAEQLALPLQRV